MSIFLDEDEARVAAILFPGKKIKELPDVALKYLQTYSEFLKKKLPKGLLLTRRESVGYFSWEEEFELEDSSDEEYETLRKQRASCLDEFVLIEVMGVDPGHNILVKVSRVTDHKIFEIPLHDLAVCPPEEYFIIEDYSMWIANYNGE